VVSIECKSFLVMLFLPEAVKTFDRRVSVSAILPFASGAPLKLRSSRSFGKSSRASIKAATFTPLLTLLLASAIGTLPGSVDKCVSPPQYSIELASEEPILKRKTCSFQTCKENSSNFPDCPIRKRPFRLHGVSDQEPPISSHDLDHWVA